MIASEDKNMIASEEAEETEETPRGFRLAYSGHPYGDTGGGLLLKLYPYTKLGWAEAADDARAESISSRGNYGLNARSYAVVIVFDDSDDPETEPCHTCPDDIIVGDRKRARRFVRDRRGSTVWNGNNHIPCAADETNEMLSATRNERG